MANTSNQRRREYKQSPWSGQAYQRPPTIDELTAESQDVLKRNPATARAMRLEAMDRFLQTYRKQVKAESK